MTVYNINIYSYAWLNYKRLSRVRGLFSRAPDYSRKSK